MLLPLEEILKHDVACCSTVRNNDETLKLQAYGDTKDVYAAWRSLCNVFKKHGSGKVWQETYEETSKLPNVNILAEIKPTSPSL